MGYDVSLVDGHIDEPKMTDEEIKKALECCADGGNRCDECPYGIGDCLDDDHKSIMLEDALDLINRKDAESERLKDELAQTEDAFNKIYEMNGSYQRKIDTIKSETIKEFAERLKRHCYFDHKDQRNAVAEVIIDHYVKEMVGE